MKKISLVFCALGLVCAGISGIAGCAKNAVVLNVYNWGDYIDETVLDDFETETGFKVNYETFATNEDMYIKVKQGGTKYDVIVPSDYMISRMIQEDMQEKINHAETSTIVNLDPRFLGLKFDETNEYSVPYLWGTFGILYNSKMVTEPVESWDIMWNPAYKGKILMMDSVRDSLAIAFLRLGVSLNTKNPADLQKAAQLLIEQKPLVLAYVGDNGKDIMAREEAALAVCWSGDAVAIREQNEDLKYVIPKEGANIWVDSMVIPKNSEHKKEALLFIDFMNRPEIARRNVEAVGYGTPNTKAFELLDKETREDPTAYPPDETLARCEVFVDIGEAANAEYNRLWTEIKSWAE